MIAAIKAAERMDGKFVVHSNDDTLSAAEHEEFKEAIRDRLRLRPVYHHAVHRIHAHIALTVIALLLERMAEHARRCSLVGRVTTPRSVPGNGVHRHGTIVSRVGYCAPAIRPGFN